MIDQDESSDFSHRGAVRYYEGEIDEGWVIEAINGIVYEPIDLPEEYQQDGLAIAFSFEERPDAVSKFDLGPVIFLTGVTTSLKR